ncbi:MAG: class I SAM-dependent methyltransferase [Candidatus Diapherotrites archaeon]|nr:class I SAM-dependent methyltransferase [Candidatus Diapherotrites archaeon]
MTWNEYWDRMSGATPFYSVVQASHWRRYEKLLARTDLMSPDILEFGGGSGMLSAKMHKRFGGSSTLVDISHEAKELFTSANPKANGFTYIVGDVFTVELPKRYDLVFSDGLIEHFQQDKRAELIKKHRDASKKYVIIFAPKPSPQYEAASELMRRSGNWFFGYEEPMQLSQLKTECEDAGLTVLAHVSGMWQNGVLCSR